MAGSTAGTNSSIGTQRTSMEMKNNGKENFGFALALMVSLFFVFGIITVLNDILIPHFKATFELGYAEAMLINLFFFGAYFIMGIPSSMVINKLGYKWAIVTGLCIVSVGCLSFYPASTFLSYYLFLASLFFIASGITLLQVAANAYVTVLGPPEKASSRISLCGGLNSTATIIGPLVGASMILNQGLFNQIENKAQIDNDVPHKTEQLMSVVVPLLKHESLDSLINGKNKNIKAEAKKNDKEADLSYQVSIINENAEIALTAAKMVLQREGNELIEIEERSEQLKLAKENVAFQTNSAKANAVPLPYFFLAGFVLVIAFIFSRVNLPKIINTDKKAETNKYNALSFKHLRLGILAIFLYVGAEVVIGSLLINYIGLPNILGLEENEAAIFVTLYWGSAALARFIGFAVLQKVKPSSALVVASIVAALLITNSIFTDGWLSLSTMVAVGFCHSIMWPVIFSLSLDGLGKYTTQGSGLLIMGVVGGALVPMLQGVLADTDFGLQNSYFVTVICYIYLIYYSWIGYKNVNPEVTLEAEEQSSEIHVLTNRHIKEKTLTA